MEIGKYKRALKASTRPKHLRRVVYQPEIVDLDVDFPSADQPFNRFAGGGLVRKLFAKLKRELPVGNDTETLMQAKALTKAVEGKPMNDAEIDMLMRSSIMDDTMQRMADDMDMSETEAYDTLVKTMQIGKPQNREGFSQGGEVLKANELISYLKENGIDVSAKNLGRFIKNYGIKKGKKTVQYEGQKTSRGKTYAYKSQPYEITGGIYKKPTKKQLQQIKTEFDKKQLKAPNITKTGKEAFLKRKQKITDLLLEGKTRKEVFNIIKDETGFGSQKIITDVVKELEDKGVKITPGVIASNKPAAAYAKERRELQKATSDPYIEGKIRKEKFEAGLGNIDLAHRASMKQNKRLGEKILSSSLGVDTPEVNRKFIKPYENFLENLYKKQSRIANKIKKDSKDFSLKKDLEKVNKQISELVDNTNGLLNGILIDEYDLSVKSYGADPSIEFGAGIIESKKVGELTPYDIDLGVKQIPGQKKVIAEKLKNISKKDSTRIISELKNNLSKVDAQTATNAVANLACPGQYADGGRVKFSRGSECYAKGLQLLDDAKFGDEKAKAKVAKGMKALKILGGVGAEILFETAFLLPSIAEGKPLDVLIGESTLGYLGLGTSEDEKTIEMSGNDPRVIRYVAAKRAFEDNKELPLKQEQMVPGLDDDFYQNMEERKKANRAVYEKFVRSNDRDAAAAAHKLAQKKKQESYDENKKGLPARTAQAILEQLNKTFIGQTEPGEVFDLAEFQDGGRVGFEDGGFTRRGFLKALGALAAVIAGLRTGKGTKVVPKTTTAKQVVENAGKGTPEWFAPLVDKIKTEGIDVPPENVMRTSGRETVTKLEVKDPVANTKDSYYLFENPDTGEVRIDVDALGVGANDGEFSLYMRPRKVEGLTDEGIQQIDEGEFFVTEDRAVGRMSGPDDYDIDLEALDTDLSGSASNWHQLEEFATGKTDKAAQTEQLKKKDFIERNPGDDIENRYGVYDPPEPDDYD